MHTSLSEQCASVSPGSSTPPQAVCMSIQGGSARYLSAEDAYSQCAAALNSLLRSSSTVNVSIIPLLFVDYTQLHACSRVPEDFLNVTVESMHHLKRNGWSNVIYLLAKALGTMHSDGLDSLLPTKRMCLKLSIFFTVDMLSTRYACIVYRHASNLMCGVCVTSAYSLTYMQIHCPEDYRVYNVRWTSQYNQLFHLSIL